MTIQATVIACDANTALEINTVRFGIAPTNGHSAVAKIRFWNTYGDIEAAITSATLYCIRGDMLNQGGGRYDGEETYYANQVGEELVDERWVEASLDNISWTPIDEWDNGLALGALALGDHVDVYVRVSVPTGALTYGDIDFNLAVRCS